MRFLQTLASYVPGIIVEQLMHGETLEVPFRKQYEWQVGEPLGVAVRTAPYRWQRSFEKCAVSVDLVQRSANFSACGFER